MANYILIETYRGFGIKQFKQIATNTLFYQIFSDSKCISKIVGGSPKGCRNIIDTHLKPKEPSFL